MLSGKRRINIRRLVALSSGCSFQQRGFGRNQLDAACQGSVVEMLVTDTLSLVLGVTLLDPDGMTQQRAVLSPMISLFSQVYCCVERGFAAWQDPEVILKSRLLRLLCFGNWEFV